MRFNGCTNVSSASSSPDILIISPHLDDAVLSCGGLLSLANARGFDACVLTVFAGEPDPGDVGPLASWIHQLCGQGEDAVSARRVEDLAAGSLLGFDSIHLDFLDCAYRRSAGRHLYPTESSVFGSIAISMTGSGTNMAVMVAWISPSVNVSPDALTQPIQVGGWRPSGVAKDAIEALINMLQVLANAAIWFVLFALPVLLVLAIPFVLLIWVIKRLRRRESRVTESEGEDEGSSV